MVGVCHPERSEDLVRVPDRRDRSGMFEKIPPEACPEPAKGSG